MPLDDQYLTVLNEFVAIVGGQQEGLGGADCDSEVSFEYDGMLAFVFQHPVEDQVLLDVELMQLSELALEPAHAERLLLLHQLNSITRFTHGAWAFVSVDHRLILSRAVPVPGLSGQGLADVLSQMLDAAASLRTAWGNLRQLIVQAGRSAEGLADAGAPLQVGHFA